MLFSAAQRRQASSIAELVACNPFTPDRIAIERRLLVKEHVGSRQVWEASTHDAEGRPANVAAIAALAAALSESARERLTRGDVRPTADELLLYEDVVHYAVYTRHHPQIETHVRDVHAGRSPSGLSATYASWATDLQRLLAPLTSMPNLARPPITPAHGFALAFQLRRAFELIFHEIIGASPAAAALRASVWQSIFTHDLPRYRTTLFDRMQDVTTLVLGESGTGKELVARAIALSRYVPFDPKRGTFVADLSDTFFPLNLSALPEALVESELFGHRRGSFTGAIADRVGRLAACSEYGTIFLDEIGDLSPGVQVKLLRVLHTRCFERLGDARPIRFRGRIVAATNRDLSDSSCGFRRDFYYRICSDVITTPTLREQLAGGTADELRRMIGAVAVRVLPVESERLVEQTLVAIERDLGRDYAWPGNFRELEQAVRNVLVRGSCRPIIARREAGESNGWLDAARAGTLRADELLSAYAAHVYQQVGTYERAGEVLGLDRRTVRANVVRHAQ